MEITAEKNVDVLGLVPSTGPACTFSAFPRLHDSSYIVPARVILSTFTKFYHVSKYARCIINVSVVNL